MKLISSLLVIAICVLGLSLAFADQSEPAQPQIWAPYENLKFTPEAIARWKSFFENKLTTDQRDRVRDAVKGWFDALPENVQNKFVRKVADLSSLIPSNNDFAVEETDPEEEDPEFICGGLCIGGAIVAAGGLAYAGHKIGKHQGKKAPPVIHRHYHDDDMGILGTLGRLTGIYNGARDITYDVLKSKNPGRHTHVYHYDDDEQAETEQVNVEGLKKWANKWRSMTPEERSEHKFALKKTWKRMHPKVKKFFENRMRKALKVQQVDLPTAVSVDDDAFVCGGFCIAAGAVAGAGIFMGAKSAGKEKTRRHIHHHYRK